MGKFADSFTSLLFAGGDRKAGELVRPGTAARDVYGTAPSIHTGGYAAGSARRQLEAYASGNQRAIDLVADCLDVICDTVATADWYLDDPTAQDHSKLRVPKHRYEADPNQRLAPPELVELLENPNPWMDYGEWVALSWIDWLLTGDSFTLKYGPNEAGQPLALYRLSPALVDVIPGEDGNLVKKYKYEVPGEEPVEYDPQDVIHIRRPNPHDPYRGAGLISAGPNIFNMEVALQGVKTAYFENGTRLGGVLETDSAVSPGLVETIRREFAGLFSGIETSYQVPVLQRGLHWKPMQGNAAEAEFVALTEKSQERILAKFGVPRRKLGLPIETSSTTAPQAEDRTFAQDKMRPAMNKFQNALTAQLVLPAWGLRFRIDYEYQMPIEDRIKLATEFATLPGVTLGEVRKFANLDELDGDNAELNDLVLNLPGDDENESTVKDKALGREPGRPPKPGNTRAIDAAAVDNPDAEVA